MGMFGRRVYALGASVLLVAACGGNDAPEAPAPPPPAGVPATTTESTSQPAPGSGTTPETTAQPPPAGTPPASAESPEPPAESAAEPRAGSGGRVGADLADVLPTTSTMAESSAPLASPEPPDGSGGSPEGIEGVVSVPVTSVDHVRHDVEYPTAPPAGGPHLGIWLNCGFYSVPVLDELAVHSLEHGAVWVTYRSDVPAGALSELAALATRLPYLLVSPYEAQDSPLVLTAWARQLPLDSLDDARFERFLDVYLFDGPTTPEPGAACSGAVGVPPEHPDAVPQQG